ncbi:hypothetical protein [Streptomyces sp. NBC_01296]|uniref:hypothetical protein n=1 Tax=Streptomyces sp. NBC_01296 TaxID=2903816 RepID=UPI002E15364D|nr:hypothetical protein OG299_03455 [Streptomyces sp. NBC_01296]
MTTTHDTDTGSPRTAAHPVDWSGEAPFPCRWVGGVALVIAPLLLAAGVLLRLPFHFLFPAQLAARADHPTLMAASYGAFAAGTVLL